MRFFFTLLLCLAGCVNVAVPPDPAPQPQPPAPNVDPAPEKTGLLVVVIVEDVKQRPTYPATKLAAMFGPAVRDYAATHCRTGPGNMPEFRVYHRDQDVTQQSQAIQDGFRIACEDMGRTKSAGPWLAVSNGKSGISCALPDDPAALLALLKKYGGE